MASGTADATSGTADAGGTADATSGAADAAAGRALFAAGPVATSACGSTMTPGVAPPTAAAAAAYAYAGFPETGVPLRPTPCALAALGRKCAGVTISGANVWAPTPRPLASGPPGNGADAVSGEPSAFSDGTAPREGEAAAPCCIACASASRALGPSSEPRCVWVSPAGAAFGCEVAIGVAATGTPITVCESAFAASSPATLACAFGRSGAPTTLGWLAGGGGLVSAGAAIGGEASAASTGASPRAACFSIMRDTEGGGMVSRLRANASSITSPVATPMRSASTMRDVVAKRSSGRLASMRATVASIHNGTPALRVGNGAGTAETCCVRISKTRLPLNGGAPESISYATQPN